MLKYYLLISFFFLNIFTTLTAQTPEKALEYMRDNYTKESIYIHYDKENYVAGETIWFKAYLMAGVIPSLYSTVLNVELLNDSGRVISKKILPVLGSTATGNFDLKKDAPQMSYTIRAYTRRMLNFGKDDFYEQSIKVFNPSSINTDVAKTPAETHLYFFPEGGNFVAGVPNIIAFKAADKYGYPLSAEGNVLDSKGNVAASFKSVHDGMGSFLFVPQPGETYTARYTISGQATTLPLPPVAVSGITFQVQTIANKKYFVINKEKLPNAAMSPAYLLGVMENNVLFRQELPSTDLIRGLLPLGDLPSGILQLTLFTKNDQPVSERMLFINNPDFLLKGRFATDTVSTAPKAKNVYSFTLEDTSVTTFSVSVTDYDYTVPANSRETIISRLMLSNDIKGYIHNPIYYFEKGDEESSKNLDLVMMTNGWRRYNWDQVLNKKLPALSYKDGNYITFEGRSYKNNTTTILPAINLFALISTKDSASDFVPVSVDNDGKFKIEGMIFEDTATLTFQQADPNVKDKSVSIATYSQPLSKQFAYLSPVHNSNAYRLGIDSTSSAIIKEQYQRIFRNESGMITLKDVKLRAVKTKSKTTMVQEKYAKGLFSGMSTHTTDLVTNPERTHYMNVFEYMKSNYAGVDVSGTAPEYFINIRGKRSILNGPIPAAIFLDGVETPSFAVSTITFDQIALIKVYSNGFVGAVGGGPGGAVAIFTKQGEDRPFDKGLGLNKVTVEGFSPVKEFFSPDYSSDNNVAADNRTTLYWNPYLLSGDGSNKVSFQFYNTAQTKKFRMVLTGMNAEGKMLYIEKIIE